MRFILIQIKASLIDWGVPQWRATHAKDGGGAIDVFFFADSLPAAKAHVLARHPTATFSDEVLS